MGLLAFAASLSAFVLAILSYRSIFSAAISAADFGLGASSLGPLIAATLAF